VFWQNFLEGLISHGDVYEKIFLRMLGGFVWRKFSKGEFFTAIYSLGHGLCTLTAVPRSTQPSTLCGTVK